MSQILKNREFVDVKMSEIDLPQTADRINIAPEAVEDLAKSILQVGLLQSILLNKKDDKYEIIFGHRRFLACQQNGYSVISATIVEYSDKEVALARATENLQRENLTPIEEAYIYSRLVNEMGLSLENAGKMTGKSGGVVKRRMDLLRMSENMQNALHKKLISITVAEELQRCSDITYQEYLLEMAVDHGVTKDVARMWVDDHEKSLRTNQSAGEGGVSLGSVFETSPVFVACETCKGPVELSEIKVLRICPVCLKTIITNIVD